MIIYPTRRDMIASLPVGAKVVEVGVQRGNFSAEILTTHVGQLLLVDPWAVLPKQNVKDPSSIDQGGHEENYRFTVTRFLREIADRRVRVRRMPSLEAAKFAPFGYYDAVYLDGDHTYEAALADLFAWEPRVRPDGGTLMGHDYVDSEESRAMGFGVVRAVDDFCEKTGWRLAALTDEEWPSFKLVHP